MMLAGQTLEYQYDGADQYRVRFGEGTATWEVLTGPHAGDSRTETAQSHEIAQGIFMVTWLEPTNEIVTFVANLNTKEITCSYTYEKEQFLWHGTINFFGKSDTKTPNRGDNS